jgi:hypothetical protein
MTTKTMKIKDFTDEEIKEIHHMMQRTWDYIAPDLLESVGYSEGKHRERVSMRRSSVVEVVLDASYMEMDSAKTAEDKELLKKFRQLSYDDQKKVARKTFTYATYGY